MNLHTDETGQALIVVAAAGVALVAAFAFAIDWGYGLAQRRITQNIADAGALAGAKLLAASVQVDSSFAATQEAVWCEAARFLASNNPFQPADQQNELSISFSPNGTTWTTAITGATCPAGATGTPVPATTAFVRARDQVTYPAFSAALAGRGTISAAASARARLTGSPGPQAPVLPLFRHYDSSEFVEPCGFACDPTSVTPITFWTTASGSTQTYGSFHGFVDFSRYSSRHATLPSPETVAQLLTAWDETGSLSATPPTSPRTDVSGSCGRDWDSAGGEAPNIRNERCSLPNFLFYDFGGTVSLDQRWPSALLPGQEAPPALGARQACTSAPAYLSAPSCGDDSLGDWIETTFRGRPGSVLYTYLVSYIAAHGVSTPYSNEVIPIGPHAGERYGNAVQVLVSLWDCAESFNSSASPGNRWRIIPPASGTDCSQLPSGSGATTADRIHVFAMVPFTFYAGLVGSAAIEGYWGDTVDKPGVCAQSPGACVLNPISNSVFLVADD